MDPFNVYGPNNDPSRLFVQMGPTVNFDNHGVPAHMVGAFEKSARPEVINLAPVQLGDVSLAGNPLRLNQNMGNHFQKAAFGGSSPPDIPAEYRGKAQGIDPELQNPEVRSAMQHAGEGDHEDAVPLKDRPYNNLQTSREQEHPAFEFSGGLSGDAMLQKAMNQKATHVRKVPSDVNDITETAYRSRSTSLPRKRTKAKKTNYHDDEEAESHPPARSVKRKKKYSRTKAEEPEDSEEQDQGQGRRLFNIQFGGGGGSSISAGSGGRKTSKSSGRRKPPPASHEDEEEEPAQESRRSLFRVPFRVFRGVTLNRGDDGALAFNINLG
ncbi:uncharacterized protein LOC114828197 [Galendromus occidentalis]|uniref:Uncharacterized protein LOC114828197 n=1 Tax=Galendromus occidentalis TaxID=34638 RepID=A0AAJ7SFU6_9ACAR|nr:uncharacterized protein LOC114828197 [Galendromus occidentalis]